MAVVVVAGGAARRFGADKLDVHVHGRPLLGLAMDGLPPDAEVAVVGPERAGPYAVTWLSEDPPGGGPAAGLVTGLRWGLDAGAGVILTLPGDAPGAGRAARVLLAALEQTGAPAVVGVDPDGREQVLQLALRALAARDLVEAAGPGGGQGQSVRRLVAALAPAPLRVPLSEDLARDIDTPEQLEHFRNLGRA